MIKTQRFDDLSYGLGPDTCKRLGCAYPMGRFHGGISHRLAQNIGGFAGIVRRYFREQRGPAPSIKGVHSGVRDGFAQVCGDLGAGFGPKTDQQLQGAAAVLCPDGRVVDHGPQDVGCLGEVMASQFAECLASESTVRRGRCDVERHCVQGLSRLGAVAVSEIA